MQLHTIEQLPHIHVRQGQFAQIQLEAGRVDEGGKVKGAICQVKGAAQVKMQGTGIELKSILEGIRVYREQGGDVQHSAAGSAKGLAGQHVRVRVGQLLAHDGAVGSLIDHVIGQLMQIVQPGVQDGRGGIGLGLHNAHNGQFLTVGHDLLHIIGIRLLVQPELVFGIIGVAVGFVDQPEGLAEKLFVVVGAVIIGQIDQLVAGVLLQDLVQLCLIPHSHGV